MRRVVITGIGMISPLGSDQERFWHNLINGNSGIGAIDSFDVSLYPCRIGGEVKDFDPGLYMEKREAKKVDRFTHFGVAAYISILLGLRGPNSTGVSPEEIDYINAEAVELIATPLIMRHQVIHPTINYEYPDSECDLDYVPNLARESRVNLAISNSFGFGGTNATLVVKNYLAENQ